MIPTLTEERKLRQQGYRLIAGIDEVGRGALAGPVVASAVILPSPIKEVWVKEVRDSKLLTADKREALAEHIREVAVSFGTGIIPNEIIDKVGIAKATMLAMKSAIEQLSSPPDALLIDYFTIPGMVLYQKGVVNGDSLCLSIACASIVAKVARDALMVELDKTCPGYSLAENKGYGTGEHLACLSKLGPSPLHRYSFGPVKNLRLF